MTVTAGPGPSFLGSLVTRYAHHPLLSRPDRAQPGALRAASGRGRGWECTEGNDNEPRMVMQLGEEYNRWILCDKMTFIPVPAACVTRESAWGNSLLASLSLCSSYGLVSFPLPVVPRPVPRSGRATPVPDGRTTGMRREC